MEDTGKIEKDLNVLFERTNKIDRKLIELETNQSHYVDTLEKVVTTNEKLADAIHNIQVTFTEMNGKMDIMSVNIADTKTQISGIDSRMRKVEENGKFDISSFIKKNFPWIVIGVGFIIYTASKYFKF